MRDKNGKWLTALRLSELLATLPPDSRVMPNSVGNLLVLAADGKHTIAFIDFVGVGEVERVEWP